MATFPTMVELFAETDGREVKSIEHIARLVRERGYIKNGKRGAGAPHMETRDAANLLIALCGCDNSVEAPIAIDRYRSLLKYGLGNEREEGELDTVKSIIECNNFGDALEVLIDGVPDLSIALTEYIASAYQTDDSERVSRLLSSRVAGVEVEFIRYQVAIRIYRDTRNGRELDFEELYIPDMDRPTGFYTQANPFPDRIVAVKVGLPTLTRAYLASHVREVVTQ